MIYYVQRVTIFVIGFPKTKVTNMQCYRFLPHIGSLSIPMDGKHYTVHENIIHISNYKGLNTVHTYELTILIPAPGITLSLVTGYKEEGGGGRPVTAEGIWDLRNLLRRIKCA